MKQTDALRLVSAGTLARPGPIGRLFRLVLSILCLYVFGEIFYYWSWTTAEPFSTLDNRALLLLAPLCVFNYVVNIGFTKSWGVHPLLFSIVILLVFGGIALLLSGSIDSPIFGITLNLWFAYFYGHLGLSFVLAAIIATPGCEMRAIPELAGRASGRVTEEHHCPAGFITQLDEWEHRRFAK